VGPGIEVGVCFNGVSTVAIGWIGILVLFSRFRIPAFISCGDRLKLVDLISLFGDINVTGRDTDDTTFFGIFLVIDAVAACAGDCCGNELLLSTFDSFSRLSSSRSASRVRLLLLYVAGVSIEPNLQESSADSMGRAAGNDASKACLFSTDRSMAVLGVGCGFIEPI